MKAAVVLALASTAFAVTGCTIPATYVTSAAGACTGEVAGYNVWGFCVTGADRVTLSLTAATQVRTRVSALPTAFTPAGLTATGCVIPSTADAWSATETMVAVSTTPACVATGATGLVANVNSVKGVEVRCDAAMGYWPVQGFEGSNVCLDGVGDTLSVANPTAMNDYWGAGLFQPYDFSLASAGAIGAAAMVTEFAGTNMLLCDKGCTLPTTICNNGVLNANIVGAGMGLNGCVVAPQRAGFPATTFTFRCRNNFVSPTFTATCTTFNTAAATAYAGECGTADGAQTVALWNFNNRLDSWMVEIMQAAGAIDDQEFAAVTSSLKKIYSVNLAAYATLGMHRSWNDLPFQPLKDGAVYGINIVGCEAFAGETRRRCVQHVLNYWRCEYDFPFLGGTVCTADNALIACPTHELGFRCPSSSKKGLWGLLGLLGLIPLLLICCCLLLLCCIRRRKTEADVHFATFDPHAAPVVATQPVATTCNGFTGTPFTHPSAVPVL